MWGSDPKSFKVREKFRLCSNYMLKSGDRCTIHCKPVVTRVIRAYLEKQTLFKCYPFSLFPCPQSRMYPRFGHKDKEEASGRKERRGGCFQNTVIPIINCKRSS